LANRTTVRFAGVLAILLFAGCGDDDAAPGKDGGADDGGKADSGNGSSGAGGATSHGSGGTKGTGTGSGTDDEDGGGSGMPGSGGDRDASTDAGATAGGGATDASTSDGGGTMQPAPGCGGLLDCCANLPKMDRMQCELIANNADDASCDQYKLLVCPQASPDAGTAPDPNACDTLNDCCDALPRGPVRVACASTVSAGVAVDCQQVQAALCTTSGNADACMTLVDCCNSLPPPQRASCTMVADQGLPAACETVQMALCP
jgi:hypothetical protein